MTERRRAILVILIFALLMYAGYAILSLHGSIGIFENNSQFHGGRQKHGSLKYFETDLLWCGL